MKRITERIETHKRRLSESALMTFVQDRRIDPQQRFSFVSCMAPFVMGFSDVNKYGLRDDSSQDPIQRLVNAHSREDDHHWSMYLKDLHTLNENIEIDLDGALRLLWGNERRRTRQTIYCLMSLIDATSPAVRMAIVEAIEATGDVAFTRFSQLALEFEQATGKTLYYFGALHKDLESGHAMGTVDIARQLEALTLSPAEYCDALGLVDRVFEIFHGMFEEWMTYAKCELNAARRRNVAAGQA